MNAVTDEALMIQLAGGRETALGEILTRYWPVAYQYARTLTHGDPGAAEDVAQESFLQVYLKSATYSSSLPFRPWFFRIVQNSARERFRGEKRRQSRERKAARSVLSVGEDQVEANDEWSIVEEELHRLPEDLRDTIALRFLEGFPLKTIAELSNCPEGTVSSRIRRGIELLRERISPRLSLSALALTVLLESQVSAQVPPCPNFQELIQSAKGRGELSTGASLPSALLALALVLVLVTTSQFISPDARPLDPSVSQTDPTKTNSSTPSKPSLQRGSRLGAYQRSQRGTSKQDGDPWGDKKAGGSGVGKAIEAEKSFALRGRLMLAGRPMTGVTVCLRRNGSPMIEPPGDSFTSTLDHGGRFQFLVLPGEAEFWSLEFRHDSYGQNLYYRLDPKSEFALSTKIDSMHLHQLTIEADLMPVQVRGRVRDASNQKPISGATVSLWGQSVTTDGSGRYSLLAARSVSLFQDYAVARASGRNTVAHVLFVEKNKRSKKNEWENIDFELGRGQVLRGRVVDEFGRPHAGIIVESSATIPNQSGPIREGATITGVGWSWSEVTDGDGRFQFFGLEDNSRNTLTIRNKSLTFLIQRDFGPKIGKKTMDFVVKSDSQAWRGHVVDPEGKGIAQATVLWVPFRTWLGRRFQVTLENEELVVKGDIPSAVRRFRALQLPGADHASFFSSRSDQTGAFSLDVPGAKGWVLVSAPGYGSRTLELNGQWPKLLRLNVEERLTGTVRNGEGQGIPKVLVNAYAKGSIGPFQSGTQILRGPRGLKYGKRTPAMILSGNENGPISLATVMTDSFGRYSLGGLDAEEYDLVINPLWSFLDKKSDWTVPYRKAVSTGLEWDFELKTMELATVRLKAVDAQTRKVMIGCRFSLFNEAGPLTHFSDPRKDFDPAILQFPGSDKVTLQLTKPGYGRAQLLFSAPGQSSLDLGAIAMNPEVGTLQLVVKAPEDAWKKLELLIHEEETDLWSWRERSLLRRIERIDIPDLTPGKIEIRPFLRGGEWPNETFLKLDSIHSEIERDRLTIENLNLRASKLEWPK